jgi:hypothetical protein
MTAVMGWAMTRLPAEPLRLDRLIGARAIHLMTGETCRLVGVRGEEIVAVSAEPDGLDDLAGLDLAQILHALTAGRTQRAFTPRPAAICHLRRDKVRRRTRPACFQNACARKPPPLPAGCQYAIWSMNARWAISLSADTTAIR